MNLVQMLRRRFGRLSGRSRTVGLFFASSVGARALGIGCQLLQVPVAMQALGPEAFGLWMTLTGIGNVITFADFGVGQGAQNKLAEAFASQRLEEARTLWDNTLAFFLATGLVLAVIVLGLGRAVDVGTLFNLVDPTLRQEAPTAVSVTLLLFCLGFPLGLGQRLAYSRQLGWMHNLVLAFASVGSLAGVALAARLHWGLPALIAASQVPVLLGNALLLLGQLVQLGWTRVHPLNWHPATLRELLKLGAFFGVQQVQLVLFLSLPQIIISAHLGAAAVTPYNLAQRFFNLFAVAQNAFMLPLWPAYSAAYARREFDWIRRTLALSCGATALLTLIPMAIGASFAPAILGAWVGRDAALPSLGLIWCLYTWNAVMFLGQPFGYLLAGISEVKRLTFYSVVSAIASVCLMASLVRTHGQQGVVIGMIVGFMPFLLLGNLAEIVRVFRQFPPRGAVVAPPLSSAVPPAPTQS